MFSAEVAESIIVNRQDLLSTQGDPDENGDQADLLLCSAGTDNFRSGGDDLQYDVTGTAAASIIVQG